MKYILVIAISIINTNYYTNKFNNIEIEKIKQKQILTELETQLILQKRVQQNWDRHLK